MELTQEQLQEISRTSSYSSVFHLVRSGDWTEEMFVEYMRQFARDCYKEARCGGS